VSREPWRLGSDWFIAIAAVERDEVVGGIAAYELRKFEQEDIAVP